MGNKGEIQTKYPPEVKLEAVEYKAYLWCSVSDSLPALGANMLCPGMG